MRRRLSWYSHCVIIIFPSVFLGKGISEVKVLSDSEDIMPLNTHTKKKPMNLQRLLDLSNYIDTNSTSSSTKQSSMQQYSQNERLNYSSSDLNIYNLGKTLELLVTLCHPFCVVVVPLLFIEVLI
jgi:hypothetical protein